jgi:hypothetical protein
MHGSVRPVVASLLFLCTSIATAHAGAEPIRARARSATVLDRLRGSMKDGSVSDYRRYLQRKYR